MVFCLPLLLPLLFVARADQGSSITLALWLIALLHLVVVHRPCVQCIGLFLTAVVGLCVSHSQCPLYAMN
jgi:hypothetical protein